MAYEWGWGTQPDEWQDQDWIDSNGKLHSLVSRNVKPYNKKWTAIENAIGKSYDDFTDEDYDNIPF